MGQVIAFSNFRDYYAEISRRAGFFSGAILDTNILVSLSYEIKQDFEEMAEFFDGIADLELRYFATVNTKAEFIDFHRRLTLTENLLDAVDAESPLEIPTTARAVIGSLKGMLKAGEAQGRDPIFNDTQIKKIKSEFSAGRHSGQAGWLALCEGFLKGRVGEIEGLMEDRGIEYLSPHDPAKADVFVKAIDWADVAPLVEKSGVSVSDAMILNALQCSRCAFVFSSDFDLGYASLADPSLKDVVMPDQIASEYRHYHF